MTTVLFKKYKPHSKQWRMHQSEARFKNVCAGVRSGKTFSCGREFVRKIFEDARTKSKINFLYWAVAPNYVVGLTQQEEVFKVLTEPFRVNFENIRKSPLVKYWNDNKKILKIVITVPFEGRTIKKYARVKFKSADRPESLVADTIDGLWIDEAARVKAAAWPNMRARLTTTKGWGLFSTTPMGRNWYYDQIFRLGDIASDTYSPDFENFVFYTTDNTAIDGIVEEVELAKRQMPEKYFKRDYMASFETFTGQIYDTFDYAKNVLSPEEIEQMLDTCRDKRTGRMTGAGKFKTIIIGKDWGYTNPGVSLVIGVDGDLNFYVIDCVYRTGVEVVSQSGEDWVSIDKELCGKYAVEFIFADPSEPAYIESYRKAGLPIKKADNSVSPGIQTVSTLMNCNSQTGKPRLFFSRALRSVLQEVQAYKWAEDKDDELKETPEKKNDHSMDALRYAVFTYLGKYSKRIAKK